MPPKAARTSTHPPEGQGCGFRPEVHLEGVVVSLKSMEHDGVGQELEQQEAEPCQGEPEEDETEVIQVFLHSAVCRKREEGRSTGSSQVGLQPLLVEPRDLPRVLPGVSEAESFPWACSDVLLLSAFSWELERGHVAKSFPVSSDGAKSRPGPRGSTFPPPVPDVPRYGTCSCSLHHP